MRTKEWRAGTITMFVYSLCKCPLVVKTWELSTIIIVIHLYVQPPAIRLLIVGPRGSGKTLHSRSLAKKLGVFHIQFREYLQELVIAKTKKRVLSELEEMQTAAEQDLPPEEVWVVAMYVYAALKPWVIIKFHWQRLLWNSSSKSCSTAII